MKACVLDAVGKMNCRDVETPRPQKGEVLLRIRACGICSSDIDRVFKTGTYHFPTIPGHEFSGEIIELGDGVDCSLLGRRAAVFPILPCFKCRSCEVGEYARCENYNYFGSRCDGGFAEYIAVPVWNLVLFSDAVSFCDAALCEPMAVALHAVTSAAVNPNDAVAVVGNGTIGLLSAMWLRMRGAGKIIIVGRSQEKLNNAKKLGFEYVLSSSENLDVVGQVEELTDGKGADVVYEMVGSSKSIETAIGCTKKGGKTVLTGNPSDNICLSKANYWKILRSELNIQGTWNSSYRSDRNDWHVAMECLENGKICVKDLITHTFSLEEYETAFSVMQDKNKHPIKVMFEM